jgi:hypothetical protein
MLCKREGVFQKKNFLVELHIFKCNGKDWKTEELMAEWLREVWERITACLLKKRRILVLDAFKVHLTK